MPSACPETWDCGGFAGDLRWHGTPCIFPAGHGGWHRGPDDPSVVTGYITWLVGRR